MNAEGSEAGGGEPLGSEEREWQMSELSASAEGSKCRGSADGGVK